MSVIPFLLLICSGSIYSASVLRKRAEQSLPITCMAVIAILYIFYIFDKLQIGFIIIIFMAIACYLLSFIKLYEARRKRELLVAIIRDIATPPMVMFAILCIIAFFYLRFNNVNLWDELRLWGAYPKILFYTGKLQLGDGAMLYGQMQSYPPGLALFAYLVSKSANRFYEWHIFYAYAVFYFSLFMPCLRNLKWKKSWQIVPIIVIVYLLPLTFYNSNYDNGNFYKSLFIDPILGLLAAYLIYLVFDKCHLSIEKIVQFALGLFVIILLKDTGIMFAIIALLGMTISATKEKQIKRKTLKTLTILIISILVPYLSWQCLLKSFGIHNHIEIQIGNMANSVNALKQFINNIGARTVLISNFYELDPYYTALSFIIITYVVLIVIIICSRRKDRPSRIISTLALFLSNLIFIMGLFILFINGFQGQFDSYQRYVGTILLENIATIVFILISVLEDQEDRRVKALTMCLVSISFLIFPFRAQQAYDGMWNNEASYHAKIISNAIYRQQNIRMGITTRVEIIINGDIAQNAGLHHKIYYNLISDNIFVKNFYTETNIVLPDNATPDEITTAIEKWRGYIIYNKVNYVYIVHNNDIFNRQFKNIFKDGQIQAGLLYAIDTSNNSLKFVPVN